MITSTSVKGWSRTENVPVIFSYKLQLSPYTSCINQKASWKTAANDGKSSLGNAGNQFDGPLYQEHRYKCLLTGICRLLLPVDGTLPFVECHSWIHLSHPNPGDCHPMGNTRLHTVRQRLQICLLHPPSYLQNMECDTQTSAYHPQTNITEQVNSTLKTMIASYVGSRHKHWDKHLPEFRFALNSAVHESWAQSPSGTQGTPGCSAAAPGCFAWLFSLPKNFSAEWTKRLCLWKSHSGSKVPKT